MTVSMIIGDAHGDLTKHMDPESTDTFLLSLKPILTLMLIGELNYFSMCAGYIGSMHPSSKTCEKIAFVAGPGFRKYAGRTLVVRKAL
jgi:hypothetical protein